MLSASISMYQVLLYLLCFKSVLGSEHLLSPSKDIDIDQFLDSSEAYNKYTVDHKQLNTTSLVYVTPWNKLGYEVAEIFTPKFDLISPVWFQILGKKKSYTVAGIPNVDNAWIQRIRKRNPAVKVVPRFHFEEWTGEDYATTLKDKANVDACISNIVRVLSHHKLDGAVIEIWSQYFGGSVDSLIEFLKQISKGLHDANKLFILVVPPPVYRGGFPGRFSRTHFNQLYQFVDYFSLMTYDYSGPSASGPNSPIQWVRECITNLVPSNSDDREKKRGQILTGLNFYGMQYAKDRAAAAKPILGHEVLDIVRSTRAPFKWDEESAEHFLTYREPNGDEHVVYYPSVLSIARRLSLILELSTGVSVWEIGQGLHSFYSLF